jgi:hypothetical protein
MYGRFLSPDPARDQHFEETQSWNIYSYVRNNPVSNTDPTGMWLGPDWRALAQKVNNWWSGGSKPYERQAPVNTQTRAGQSEAKYSVTETWDNKKATTTVTTGSSGSVGWAGLQGTTRGNGGFEKTERVESTYAGGLITTSVERTSVEGRVDGGLGFQDGGAKIGGSLASIGEGSAAGLQLNLFGYSLNILEVKGEFTFGSISAEGKASLSKEKGLSLTGDAAFGAGGKLDLNILGVPVKQLPPPPPDRKPQEQK